MENGQPVTGTRTFIFTIDTWTETHTDIPIEDGLYSVQLGSINPIPFEIFTDNATATLQISVDGTLLVPTTDILSVPYAFKAGNAHSADQLGGVVYLDNNNVGIGTTTPQAALDINSGGIRLGGETRYAWPQGADNLGDHTATQNIKLNGHWLSSDGNNEGVYVNNYGNVGVGTSNLSSYFRLDVNGMLKVRNNIVLYGNWLSGDGNDEGVYVNNYGNVGVGTNNPRERLEVNGAIRANSNFNTNGVDGVSGEFQVTTDIQEHFGDLWIYHRLITVKGGIITGIGPKSFYMLTP